MTDYLVFRLYAPLASWGTPAVGERRPSADHPGRGALLGIIGAAMGIRRDDSDALARIDKGLAFGIRQRTSGTLLRDYHTTQVPSSERNVRHRTRRDELSGPGHRLNTVLSTRDYRCDGLWTVAVWLAPEAQISLQEVEQALLTPRFVLYLGRKACPLGAPLAPRIVSCRHLKQALDIDFPALTLRPGDLAQNARDSAKSDAAKREVTALGITGAVQYVWEGEATSLDGIEDGVEVNHVWDQPLDRQRWQFGARSEFRRTQQIVRTSTEAH